MLAEVDRAARVRGAYGELPTDMTLQFHGRPTVMGQPHTTITLAPLLAWQVCAGSGRTRGMTSVLPGRHTVSSVPGCLG